MATSIRSAADVEERLDALAEQTGRSKAFYLRQMIENGLEDVEDYSCMRTHGLRHVIALRPRAAMSYAVLDLPRGAIGWDLPAALPRISR